MGLSVALPKTKVVLAILGSAFTIALAAWWMIFGLRQLDLLHLIVDGSMAVESLGPKLVRQHQMLIWEGGILLFCLVGGGAALISYARQERKRHHKLKEFFATFSHELKTSLTSLRLQGESLQDDLERILGDKEKPAVLERLLNDTVRVQIQLENSLFLANFENSRLFVEKLSLQKVLSGFQQHWPEAKIILEKDCVLEVDARALESVLKNLIHNALLHGKAKEIQLVAKAYGDDSVQVMVSDDGEGFDGDGAKLGTLFHRHTQRSGSGVGLYLAKQLMKKMGGDIHFLVEGRKFSSVLVFRGVMA